MRHLIFLIFVSISLLALIFLATPQESSICFERSTLPFMDICLKLENASTEVARAQGFMNRTEIPSDLGMLFIFDDSQRYAFWMKDTLVPLDMIWLSKDMEVVHHVTAEPCRIEPCMVYKPPVPARYVLETKAGFVKRNNVILGEVPYLN